MIELKNISYSYNDGNKALVGLNLLINKGEKIVVVGPNGAGKSTLFLLLNAVLKAKEGSYCFKNKKISYSKNELLELRKSIGIVFQESDNQLFSLNVLEELAFGPMNLKLEKEEVASRIELVMKQLDIVDLKYKSVHSLSSGQKKRVAIASVLTMQPEVLIFDEPTAGVDAAHTLELVQLFNSLYEQGKTIIVSTHDMNFAYEWADRILVLNEGRIVCDASVEYVFGQHELLKQCKIELPLILQIYNGLNNKSVQEPRNLNELISHLNNYK